MTVNETVVRRMSFPLTRRITHRIALAGAMVASVLAANYLESQTEPEVAVEDDSVPVGFYL